MIVKMNKIKDYLGGRGLENDLDSYASTLYYEHKEMIVGVKIRERENCYWNNTVEVLLNAVHNGYRYRAGIPKYKSRHALSLNISMFIKHILNGDYKEDPIRTL